MVTRKARRKGRSSSSRTSSALISLTVPEIEILVRIARYYQKAMGPARLVVRFIAPRDIRVRYQFIAEESRILERFAASTYEEATQADAYEIEAALTPRAVVAFWGRLLASLHSRRSRRRLSADQIAAREALVEKLESAAVRLWLAERDVLERELLTRKPLEAEWMREKLTVGR